MMVNFNREKLVELKKMYETSVKNNVEVFIFEGNELLTDYAKYLIQYLETKLN